MALLIALLFLIAVILLAVAAWLGRSLVTAALACALLAYSLPAIAAGL